MSDYKGLKIPEKITIVERPVSEKGTRTIPQGYVVPTGDKKMLESAHRWADYTPWEWNDDLKRSIQKEPVIGIDHTYENGKFRMTVKESAAGSWQGGKLSFWTCEIEAPDGKKFDIGINSDYLCETIMHNTLINGVVQEKVYLGKVKGNTMAVTKHQPSYAQAMHDESKRQEKQSSKYKPGDVVKTLTETDLYLGVWYALFNLEQERESSWYWGGRRVKYNYKLTVYDQPKERHAFIGIYSDGQLEHHIQVKNTRPKRVLTEETREVDRMYDRVVKSLFKKAEDDKFHEYYNIYDSDNSLLSSYKLEALKYSDNQNASIDVDMLIAEIKAECIKYNYVGNIKVYNEQGSLLRELVVNPE